MPVFKYRDPQTGEWVSVGGMGGGSGEVEIPITEEVPSDANVWIDPSEEGVEPSEPSEGGGSIYIGEEPPTGEDVNVWIDMDDAEGEFYNKAEVDALIKGATIPYETGLWNPIFGYAVETTPATITEPQSIKRAFYVKIGKLVYVYMKYTNFSITDPGVGTAAVIRNLPFKVDGDGEMCVLNWRSNATTEEALYGGANSAYNCFYPVTSEFKNLTWKNATIPSNGEIKFSAIYYTMD